MIIVNRFLSGALRGVCARTMFSVFAAGLLAACSLQGKGRVLQLTAPSSVGEHAPIEVQVDASTDLGGGERIGFLHVEHSIDGGKTWKGLGFEQDLEAAVQRTFTITSGAAGVPTIVRVRVAYRGGAAGDVDFSGKPIQWDGSWGSWAEPPARSVAISVQAR